MSVFSEALPHSTISVEKILSLRHCSSFSCPLCSLVAKKLNLLCDSHDRREVDFCVKASCSQPKQLKKWRKPWDFCLVPCWSGTTCLTTVIREHLSDLLLLVGTTDSSSATHPARGSAEMKTTAIYFLGRCMGQEVPVLPWTWTLGGTETANHLRRKRENSGDKLKTLMLSEGGLLCMFGCESPDV